MANNETVRNGPLLTIVTRTQKALTLLAEVAGRLDNHSSEDEPACGDCIDDIRTARAWLIEEIYPDTPLCEHGVAIAVDENPCEDCLQAVKEEQGHE